MNYIEAVKALSDGECKGIRRKNGGFAEGSYLIFKKDPTTFGASKLQWNTGSETFAYDSHILAEDWYLIEPKVVKEIEHNVYTNRISIGVDEFVGRQVKITIETV